jgi:hypothetical protein
MSVDVVDEFDGDIPDDEREEASELLDIDKARKAYGSEAVTASPDGGSFHINVAKAREHKRRHAGTGKDMVWVDTYVRSDGATVRGHWRKNTHR